MPHIVVLGAGVIGLQCALNLLEAGHQVTIMASHLPGDEDTQYTSPWAGAHWRTHADEHDTRQQRWDLETYSHWVRQIRSASTLRDRASLGLKLLPSLNYWDSPPRETIWWAPHVLRFATEPTTGATVERTNHSHPCRARVRAAASFVSVAVNAPVYLQRLRDRIESLSGAIRRGAIPLCLRPDGTNDLAASLDRVVAAALAPTATALAPAAAAMPPTTASAPSLPPSPPAAFVNATGLFAARLCADSSCYPVRGQTVLVRGEADAIRTRIGDGYISYVIPRPGSGCTVLGGTKEVGVGDAVVSEEVTRAILEGAKGLAPELLDGEGEFEVVRAQVGLRPAREGGARVEAEEVGRWKVVHAYGLAGAGYQNSVGVSGDVAGLVAGMLAKGDERAKL